MALAKQAEPKARLLHASFRIGRYIYIWAGTGCRTDVVERLNLSTFTYEQRHLTNSSAPDVLDSMAVTWDESHGYTFGGRDGRDGNRKRLNSIYCLNFSTLKCIEIVPATGSDTPTPRDDCGMVHFNRKLVVYGGFTDDGLSSDLLLFDLDNSKYCKIMCVYVFVSCTPETRTVVSANSLPITVVCSGKLLIQFLCALIAFSTETLLQYLPTETYP